jgi:hypothetical protein
MKRYTVYTSPAVTVAAAGVGPENVGVGVGVGVNESITTTTTTTPASATAIPSLPPSLDWRSEGKVAPVRDQGVCMCAYAHAAAAALETAIAVAGGVLTPLSVQSLVDCVGGKEDEDTDTDTHTHIIASKGCNGGWPLTALTHIQTQGQGKLVTEEEYPFYEVEGVCPSLASMAPVDPPLPATAEQPQEQEEINTTATPTTTTTTTTGALPTATTASTTRTTTKKATTPTQTQTQTQTQTHTPLLTDVALVPRGDETLLAAAVMQHGAVVVTIEMQEDFLFCKLVVCVCVCCISRGLEKSESLPSLTHSQTTLPNFPSLPPSLTQTPTHTKKKKNRRRRHLRQSLLHGQITRPPPRHRGIHSRGLHL